MDRILIVADDALARAGLAALLADQRECAIVGQIARAEMTHAVGTFRPDVLVWTFDGGDDLRDAGVPVVALVAEQNAARQAWSSGARGILPRSASGEHLAATISAVACGLIVFDPAFASSALPASSRETLLEQLTPRENQVLGLMAQGQSNKEIARTLGISEHTVKFHVNAILGKLSAQSRTEAVITATRLGLVML